VALIEGEEMRKLIVGHHVTYYTVEVDRVLIRAILHESRIPDSLR